MHKQCYGDQFFSIIYLAQTFSRRYQPGYNAFVWLRRLQPNKTVRASNQGPDFSIRIVI